MGKVSYPPKKGIKGNTIFEKINIFTENENMACKYVLSTIQMNNSKNSKKINISLLHLNISPLPLSYR